jgi:hypothetical protein
VLKRFMALTLVSLLMQFAYVAAGQDQKDTRHADKMRAVIAKVGSCPKGKVEVTLLDNTRVKGCVMDGAEDQFVVVNSKTGQATKVAYAQVVAIKPRPLSGGGIGVLIALAAAPIILTVAMLASIRD